MLIPSTVTFIGNDPFGSCIALTRIEVNETNEVFESDEGVLINKREHILVQCPAGKTGTYKILSWITTIGVGAFEGCNQLTSIDIPENVTSILNSSFYKCSNLRSLTIPTTVTSIGEYAFFQCGITSIVIPENVMFIGDFSFKECNNLKYVSYLGSLDPGLPDSIIFESCALNLICVPESYMSATFCGENIACRSLTCDVIDNKCYDFSVDDDCVFTFWKKEATKEWENLTTGCVEYLCDNKTGYFSRRKCNTTMCVNDHCAAEDKNLIDDDRVRVEIEVKTSEILPLSSDEIVDAFSDLIGVTIVDAVIEYDENGHAIRVVVYVDDIKAAYLINTTVAECIQE